MILDIAWSLVWHIPVHCVRESHIIKYQPTFFLTISTNNVNMCMTMGFFWYSVPYLATGSHWQGQGQRGTVWDSATNGVLQLPAQSPPRTYKTIARTLKTVLSKTKHLHITGTFAPWKRHVFWVCPVTQLLILLWSCPCHDTFEFSAYLFNKFFWLIFLRLNDLYKTAFLHH